MGYILKLLIFFIAAWVVVSFVKRLIKSDDEKDNSSEQTNPEQMGQCAQCGIYVPQSKANIVSGKTICASCQQQNTS